MSSMPTTDETASSLPAAAVAGLITDSPTRTDLSVVPSSTAPIQPGSTQAHPIALPLDDALITSINPLQNDNWLAWKTRVSIVLQRRGLFHLVTGSEPQPTTDVYDATQWHVRDLVAQELIVCTMSDRQLVHVFGCRTAAAMWHTLVTVHEPETWWPRARAALERRLYTTCADEGADVPTHLDEMRTLRHRLSVAGKTVGDAEFAGIVVESLPPSWSEFTGWSLNTNGMSVPEIVSVLNEEYKRRKAKADAVGKITYTVDSGREASKGRSKSKVVKCDICSKFGHADKDCWFNSANRGKGRVNKGSRLGANRAGKERTNVRRVQQAITPVGGLDEWDI